MKKRKLKGFVLPTLYFIITISVFIGVVLIGQNFVFEPSDYDYGIGALQEQTKDVIKDDITVDNIVKSPVDENITTKIHFYEKDADNISQQNSLIYYENTYMPNTGLLYESTNEFEVKALYNGKVIEIMDDEFFGKCVVIEHASNLKSYYYGLDDIVVAIGDEITTGTEIGISSNNAINNANKTALIEVYYNNELINPEKFIGSKITDYK